MKRFFTVLLLLGFFALSANPGDTTWVTVHNNTQLTWYQRYSAKALFPNGSKSYHKILMYYTMGCASGGCSDWDYTTRVNLLKPTGVMDSNVASIDTISTNPLQVDTTWDVFEVKERYELARVMTPYGGNLNNNWKHTFMYDVTDFYPLLKDSVEIEVFYQGWSSGFSATIKFAMIEGTPAHYVTDISNLYHGYGDYITSADFEANNLPPKTVNLDPATTNMSLRVNFSGHGFVNSLNCGEFCKKNYYVKVNGNQAVTQAIWRDDCGLNPVFPQAGTWLFDRANWCPGNKSLYRMHDLSNYVSGSSVDINVDLDNYSYTVPSGETPAGYNYSVQLFQYSAPTHQYDVELEDIISPSDEDENSRMNPVCGSATVRIRNKGEQALTTCDIVYGMKGGAYKVYHWSGNLAFMQSAEVQLPISGPNEWMTTNPVKIFYAKVANPDAQIDENQWNDYYENLIKSADVFPAKVKLLLRTNSVGSDTHWKLEASDGTLIDSADNLAGNTLFTSYFDLQPGCYIFTLEDRGKNGLSFFANNDGSGYVRFQNDGGNFFTKVFPPDFGTQIKEYFTVGYGVGLNEENTRSFVGFYPNPSHGKIDLDVVTDGSKKMDLTITDLSGKPVFTLHKNVQGELKQKLDLSFLPAGIYLASARVGDDVKTQKLVIQ